MEKRVLILIILGVFIIFGANFVLARIPCTDSDNGLNYNVAGVCTSLSNGSTNSSLLTYNDVCTTGTQLKEFYCSGNSLSGTCTSSLYTCGAGQVCSNGACVKENNTITCTDSDGGINYNVKGTATKGTESKTDVCLPLPMNYLGEYYCLNNSISMVSYNCSFGCSNGACRNQTNDCTMGRQCINSTTQGFRGDDCSWSNIQKCTYGCSGSGCINKCTKDSECNWMIEPNHKYCKNASITCEAWTIPKCSNPGQNNSGCWGQGAENCTVCLAGCSIATGVCNPSCTPSRTCQSHYYNQCGVNMSDGCNNVLDCRNNCASGFVCSNSLCIKSNPNNTTNTSLSTSTEKPSGSWLDSFVNFFRNLF